MPETLQRALPVSGRDRSETRSLLIDVAEQMFAEHGLDAVSLRAVAHAAHQRNNSAAQYHFGSREGLIEAIISARSGPIEAERLARLGALHAQDSFTVRDLVEVFVAPLAALISSTPGWYLSFLCRIAESGTPVAAQPAGIRTLHRDFRSLMPAVPPATFERRMHWLSEIALRCLAQLESTGASPERTAEVVLDLLVMLEAMLLARVER